MKTVTVILLSLSLNLKPHSWTILINQP